MIEKNKKDVSKTPTEKDLRGFHMEAHRSRRGMSVVLSGIIGISDFSDSRIMLMSHGGRVAINGKRLFISVYERGNVEIIGRVEGIDFKYGKN